MGQKRTAASSSARRSVGRGRVEHHHLVVLADLEDAGGLGLAHAVALAQVAVDDDAHQAPAPGVLRATARRR